MALNEIPSTVKAAMRELGSRMARIRLSRNLTQARLAREAGASVSSIKRIELGENTSLDTFIRVLMALNLEDHLSGFLPNPDVRPVERIRREGRERKRARGHAVVAKASEWAWGEEGEE
jgi:transcriptional regulator with XRE-family HTH domain